MMTIMHLSPLAQRFLGIAMFMIASSCSCAREEDVHVDLSREDMAQAEEFMKDFDGDSKEAARTRQIALHLHGAIERKVTAYIARADASTPERKRGLFQCIDRSYYYQDSAMTDALLKCLGMKRELSFQMEQWLLEGINNRSIVDRVFDPDPVKIPEEEYYPAARELMSRDAKSVRWAIVGFVMKDKLRELSADGQRILARVWRRLAPEEVGPIKSLEKVRERLDTESERQRVSQFIALVEKTPAAPGDGR